MIALLPGVFVLVIQRPFGAMAFSLVMFHMLGIGLCWCLSNLRS